MVFRSALRPFKAMFRLKASMSRVLLLLYFDHRQRIQFFRSREFAFRVQGAAISSDHKKQNPISSMQKELLIFITKQK
jgi:hypothetical protein